MREKREEGWHQHKVRVAINRHTRSHTHTCTPRKTETKRQTDSVCVVCCEKEEGRTETRKEKESRRN